MGDSTDDIFQTIADTWAGKAGAVGVAFAIIKTVFIIWNRFHPHPINVGEVRRWKLPLLGWLGRRLAIESTVITQAIRIKAQEAQIAQLRRLIREAGIDEGLSESDDSSLNKPTLIPTALRASDDEPNETSETLPGGTPSLPTTSG